MRVMDAEWVGDVLRGLVGRQAFVRFRKVGNLGICDDYRWARVLACEPPLVKLDIAYWQGAEVAPRHVGVYPLAMIIEAGPIAECDIYATYYRRFSEGEPAELPPQPMGLVDAGVWERQ